MKTKLIADTIITISDSTLTDTSINQINLSVDLIDKSDITKHIWGLPIEVASIVIPTIITLTIFILGFIINWFLSRWKQKNYNKKIIRYISEWIILLKRPVIQQARDCNSFAVRTRNSIEMDIERFEITLNNSNNVNELGFSNIFDSLIINLKGDFKENSARVYNLYSFINNFHFMSSDLNEKFDLHKIRLNSLAEQWNKEFREFDIIKSSYTIWLTKDIPDFKKKYLIDFNKLCNQWYASQKAHPNRDLLLTKTTLLDPIFDLSRDAINNNLDNEFAYNIARKVSDLILIILDWVSEKNKTAETFFNYASHILNTYKLANQSVDQLNNLKLKSIFQIN